MLIRFWPRFRREVLLKGNTHASESNQTLSYSSSICLLITSHTIFWHPVTFLLLLLSLCNFRFQLSPLSLIWRPARLIICLLHTFQWIYITASIVSSFNVTSVYLKICSACLVLILLMPFRRFEFFLSVSFRITSSFFNLCVHIIYGILRFYPWGFHGLSNFWWNWFSSESHVPILFTPRLQ